MKFRYLFSTAISAAFIFTGCTQTEKALIDSDEPNSEAVQQAELQEPTVQYLPTEDAKAQPQKVNETRAPTPERTAPVTITAPPSQRQTPFNVRRCINIGNALEAPNEGEWGYRIRARDFQTVARAGFDTVRLPVRWDTHTAHRHPYAIDPAYMARVQQVVGQAQAAGLGVIVDVHHYESLIKSPGRQEARFLAIWDQIAHTFKDAPPNVYFEALNEPTRDISMAQVNALYAKLMPVIRRTNPTRKVILGGNSWNSVDTIGQVQWPKDANLVATYHDYGPHAFTHQGAEWSEPVMPLGRRWGGREDEAEFNDTFQLANAFKTRSGLPVFVGEFGVIDKVPQAERNQWMKMRRQRMEASGISWCAWDMMGAFKLYDIEREQWRPGVLDALFSK